MSFASVRADLGTINAATLKAMKIMDGAQQTATLLDPAEVDTQLDVSPTQKQIILNRLAPVLVTIKTLAAGLPNTAP